MNHAMEKCIAIQVYETAMYLNFFCNAMYCLELAIYFNCIVPTRASIRTMASGREMLG